MLRLYYAPRTRSMRIVWLLEELELPYELERAEFQPPAKTFFGQATPLGKFPTLEDGDLVMCESGAIVEYILEQYGQGRLAPVPGAPNRAVFLQWLHFAESTAFPPLGIIVWLTLYREDADLHKALIEDTKGRAASGFDFVERALEGQDYLVGNDFTAADIMMGFTLLAAQTLGVLDERYKNITAYLMRLAARPACQKALNLD